MSELQLSIGRDPQADIVIQDSTVSKFHAVLTIRYYDDMEIEDSGSSNGTFINERRIKKSMLTAEDKLRLGDVKPDMKVFFDQIFEKYKASKNDFSREYLEMLLKFKKYQKQKDALINQPKGPVLMRIAITIVILGILGFFPDIIPNANMRFLLMASVSLISVLSSLVSPSVAKKNEALDKLRLKYEDILVCPKCKIRLINNNYTYYEGRKRCTNDKCDARYQV